MPYIVKESVKTEQMLNKIRNINLGYILLLIGVVIVISGISMKEGIRGENTLLCFGKGCVYIQGISNIVIGCLTIATGVFLKFKRP